MRLTNSLRDSIIRSIMDDVPQVDYQEQIDKLLTDWAVSIMPAKVRAVWDDKELRHYIEGHYFNKWLGDIHISASNIPAPTDTFDLVPKDVMDQCVELEKLDRKQNQEYRELRSKLVGVVNGCTTTQALVRQLPEFAKYIPQDDPKSKNLPALANLVTDFVKAGWPKGGKPGEVVA